MHFELNEEQKLIRKMVRDFAENEVKPIAQEVDKEQSGIIDCGARYSYREAENGNSRTDC